MNISMVFWSTILAHFLVFSFNLYSSLNSALSIDKSTVILEKLYHSILIFSKGKVGASSNLKTSLKILNKELFPYPFGQ